MKKKKKGEVVVAKKSKGSVAVAKVKERKVYDLPGQKHDPPEEVWLLFLPSIFVFLSLYIMPLIYVGLFF